MAGLVVAGGLGLLQVQLSRPDFFILAVQLFLLFLQEFFIGGDELVLVVQFLAQVLACCSSSSRWASSWAFCICSWCIPNKAMRTFSDKIDMTPKVMTAMLIPVRMVTRMDVYFGRKPNNLIFRFPTRGRSYRRDRQ